MAQATCHRDRRTHRFFRYVSSRHLHGDRLAPLWQTRPDTGAPPKSRESRAQHKTSVVANTSDATSCLKATVVKLASNHEIEHMRDRKQYSEITETRAFKHRICSAARTRSHQAAPPPRLDHGIFAEAAPPASRCETAQKIVNFPRTKNSTGIQNEMSPLAAKNVKKRFSTTRSPKCRAVRREVWPIAVCARVAIETVERDCGDRQKNRRNVRRQRIVSKCK